MPDSPQFSGDYIVGWKLRIIVRIDEFAGIEVVRDLKANPITPPQTMRGVNATRSSAVATQVAATGTNPAGYAVTFAGGTAASPGGPQGVDSSSDGLTFTIGGVIPKSWKHQLNGFKAADTMTCEMKYVDLPFDPMCFRSVGVELFYGTMTQDDYMAGMDGATRQTTTGSVQSSEPLNVIPDGFTGPSGEQRSNLRFQGFVDEWEVDFSDENLAIVRFKCSDNTRLLMDQPISPGDGVSTTVPIDQAVAQLLAKYPQFVGLTVEYRPTGVTIPVFGKAFADCSQLADRVTPTQGGAAQSLSVWDYLVEVCGALGHNIRVENTTIVIQRIRAALGKNFPSRDGDPFTGRTWGGSNHLLRTFIWGRNCKGGTKRRKYARTGMNVECRSYDPAGKVTRVARYPPGLGKGSGNSSTNRLVHALPGDGRQETKYTVYPVPGVTDQTTLNQIAQAYFEGLNRAEVGVSVHTRDLASYGGDASDPDVLDMFAGDRFEYLTERFDTSTDGYPGTDLAQIEDTLLQVSKAHDYLVGLGFDPGLVTAYCAAYANLGFQTTFIAKTLSFSGSIEDEGGIDIHIDGVNMVEARVDIPGSIDQDDAALGARGTAPATKTNQPSGGP